MANNSGLLSSRAFAQYIDHTLLRPGATASEIRQLCNEAREFCFKAVCVERQYVADAARYLSSSGVLVATVVGFPSGTEALDQKVAQAREAVKEGANEIDVVLNRRFLKERNYERLLAEIRTVVETGAVPIKVILETSELSGYEKAIACAVSQLAGAHFVKTSTGFSSQGATESDVRLMRQIVAPTMEVKASGGIRSLGQALRMVQAGATRLGTSASVAIAKELAEKERLGWERVGENGPDE